MKALGKQKELDSILPEDGSDCEEVLPEFARAGVDALSLQLSAGGRKILWANLERTDVGDQLQERGT